MNVIDDRSPPLVKQSRVRKLRTHTRSTTSSTSSANTSPKVIKEKLSHQGGTIDTDEGYASVTTASTTTTTLASTSSSTWNKDDSAYYTIASERAPSSSSRLVVESDSDKTDSSDEDDALRDLVDWPSLNLHVQALVSRLDKWLHDPLPERHLAIEQPPYVEHAYPILQRRTPGLPLSINLADVQTDQIPTQSNYVVKFVQKNESIQPKASPPTSTVPTRSTNRPRVHFNLPSEELQHCTSCSRLIQLASSTTTTAANKQHSFTSCPYCAQVYCSKICQKTDWPVHKRRCALSYSYSCCGHILRLMKSNIFLLRRLSTLASSGYLASGRGATLLYFDSMKEADTYVQSNIIENTRLMAVYWPLIDANTTGLTSRATQNLRSIEYEHLKELCSTYDPKTDFVCHVTIRVETEIDDPRYTCVSRTIVYKLLDIQSDPQPSLKSSTYPTLYLTSINYGENNSNNQIHMRHVFFANLQVELRARGIEIEKHYPELYNKLCNYINTSSPTTDNNIFPFTPVCLFMRHRYSNQLFMCVITPESEPDRSWLLDRCLIEQQLAICQRN